MKKLSVTLLSLALFAMSISAARADWGYEQQGQPNVVQPLSAGAALPMAPLNNKKPTTGVKGKTSPAVSGRKPGAAATLAPKAAAPKAAAPQAVNSKDIVGDAWLQLYEFVSQNPLSAPQKSQVRSLYARLAASGSGSASQAKAALIFWPGTANYIISHPDQKKNYEALFKALLRFRGRVLEGRAATDPLAKAEAELILEVLGPVRLATIGAEPALSEDAIDAYADMACFLYEQKNPGKTIDAIDNRAMFANIVSEKYRNAPTRKDREAMAAFDLLWAKFKVVWTAANESQRTTLLSKLINSGAASATTDPDPILTTLLKNWP